MPEEPLLSPVNPVTMRKYYSVLLLVVGSAFWNLPSLVQYLDSPTATETALASHTARTIMSASEFRSQLYYNLSCPYEWSKFSCVLQGQTARADASRELVVEQRQVFLDAFVSSSKPNDDDKHYLLPPNARLVITGDSLMRQIFTSTACLLHQFAPETVNETRVNWVRYPSACNKYPSCVRQGVHSFFTHGSIWLHNGAEIHFCPHFAGLGATERNMYRRMDQQSRMNVSQISLAAKNTALPTRHGEYLTNRDVIVANVGIHYKLDKDKETAKLLAGLGQRLHQNQTVAPKLWYITTPTQHFNTHNGQYSPNATGECLNATTENPRATIEYQQLSNHNGITLMDYDDLHLGYFHVGAGAGDCSHYCMPGPPDLVAGRLLRALQAVS